MPTARPILIAFAVMFGLVCSVGAMGGCRPSEPSRDGLDTIHYWRTLSGPAGTAQTELVAQFNAAQSTVAVQESFQGGYSELATKLQAAASAGRGPEVAQLGTFEILAFARRGLLADLTPYVEGDRGLNPEYWPPESLEAGRIDGALFWLPFNLSVPVLYWNQEAFAEAGLTGPPETWDDLFAYAHLLTMRNEAGRVTRTGVSLWQITWPVVSAVWSEGGRFTTPGYAEITLDDPEAIRVLSAIQSLIRTGAASFPDAASGGHRAEFLNGRTAMILDSQAIFAEVFTGATPFTPKASPFPAGRAGRVYAPGGGGLVIPATASMEARASAWEFIRWLLDLPQLAYMFEHTGYFASPAVASAVGLDILEDPRYAMLLEALPYVRGDFSLNMMPPLRDAFDNAYRRIMTSPDADVRAILEEANVRAEAGIRNSGLMAR